MARSLAVLALGLFLAAPAVAEILRYTDDAGNVHFVESVHEVPARYRDRVGAPSGGNYSRVETSGGLHPGAPVEPAPEPAASDPGALGEVLSRIAGQPFDLASNAGYCFLLLVLPLGAVGLFMAQKLVKQHDENLGTKSLIAAFCQRVAFGIGFWILVITGVGADLPALLGAHWAAAALASVMLFSGGLGRALVAGLAFVVIDNLILAAALLGTVAAFA